MRKAYRKHSAQCLTENSLFRLVHMHIFCRNSLFTALAVRSDTYHIAHASGRDKDRVLFTEHFGDVGLRFDGGRVFALVALCASIITKRNADHIFQHFFGRKCYRITSQINGFHLLALHVKFWDATFPSLACIVKLINNFCQLII